MGLELPQHESLDHLPIFAVHEILSLLTFDRAVYTRPLPPESQQAVQALKALTPIAETNHNEDENTPSTTQITKETAMTEAYPDNSDKDMPTPTIGAASSLNNSDNLKVDPIPYPFAAKTQEFEPPETPPLSVSKPLPSSAASVTSEFELDQQRFYAAQANIRSPVVEDTLSDIEEAISELSISRNSRDSKMMKHRHSRDRIAEKTQHMTVAEIVHPDSSSEYSRLDVDYAPSTDGDSMLDSPLANVNAVDVRHWTPSQVSDYLLSCGISADLANKFEDQEISGTIALQLEHQHLKELDLGSFGKRFEVWKVLEELQKKVASASQRRSDAARTSQIPGLAISENGRKRSSTIGTPSSRSSLRSGKLSHQIDVREANKRMTNTPQWLLHTPAGVEQSPPFERPRSPPSVYSRQSQESRRSGQPSKRLSSTESWTGTGLNAALMNTTAILHAGADDKYHNRQSSNEWQPQTIIRPSTATGVRSTNKTSSAGTDFTQDSGFQGSVRLSDKSYFSGGEGPKERKVLHKKAHGRKPSYTEEQRARSATSHSRHSRVNSSESAGLGAGTQAKSNSVLPQTSILASAVDAIKDVTKRKSNSFSTPPGEPQFIFSNSRLSPTPNTAPFIGKRGITDPGAVSEAEGSRSAGLPHRSMSGSTDKSRELFASPTSLKRVEFGETGSTVSTPSVDTAESDLPSAKKTLDDEELKEKEKRLRNATSASGLRGKKKHQTSAWLEGLRDISPAAAAADADFSGWMQKRGSGAIAATWKLRFFVLKGKRLSYFYSEHDTRERGLIDINSHRVLPATDDRLVNMHATLAAVTSPAHTPIIPSTSANSPASPYSPNATSTPGTPQLDPSSAPPIPEKHKPKKESWFTFKLVPPAPGASKGVTFTPPKLHYFATSTRAEGKAWMGALLKATIERDQSKPIVSSFSAKTISLKKARELRARPPELRREEGEAPRAVDRFGLGLAIEGLGAGGGLGVTGTGGVTEEVEREVVERMGRKEVSGAVIT